jgi:outer membrane protein
MNTAIKTFPAFLIILLMPFYSAFGQKAPSEWTLRNCIDYALQNNIQIKKLQVEVKVNESGYEQSKAARFPSLSAGVDEAVAHQKAIQADQSGNETSFTGNYSLRSDLTLFNGFKITNNIAQQENYVKSAGLGVKEQQNNIELAVTSAYLQVLYAREAVTNAENTIGASEAQRNRSKTLLDAGYIAESNYAQIEAQYSNDAYSLVIAQNNLSQQLLTLRQLLELDINQEFNLHFPDLKSTDVLQVVSDKQVVYNSALGFMPEIESCQLAIQSADLDIKIAKAGLLPSLSLSASTATGQSSLVSNGFATQLGDNFYQNAGLSLTIPIYSNRQVKTSISKAQLGLQTARLTYAEIQKDLLKQVESAYLAAVSAQSRFQSADEQLKSTNKSYSLTEDQFNLGMKNTVDLLTEKNKYLAAQQEYLQAKYQAILNYKILDFYQQKKIEL